MKKKLSLLLVLALIISLVPMSAFAATGNSVTKIMTVKDDAILAGNAPLLKIDNDDNDLSSTETFVLRLNNAEWLDKDDIIDSEIDWTGYTTKSATTTMDAFEATVAQAVYDKSDISSGSGFTKVEVDRKSDEKLEVTIEGIGNDDIIYIPLFVEMDGKGVATVSVNAKSGAATESELKFANGGDSNTTIRIIDTSNFSDDAVLDPIEIEENSIGAIDLDKNEDGYIKLKLDDDFKFENLSNATIDAEIFVGGPFTIQDLIDAGKATINNDKDELKIFVKGNGNTTATGIELQSASVTATIEIVDLGVEADAKAKEGKVELTISSNIDGIDTTTLEIGEFAEYKVEVTVDGDAEEIFTGRYEVTPDYTATDDIDKTPTRDNEHELATLVIDEKTEGSWDPDKALTVEFPKWVKILSVDFDGDDGDEVVANTIDIDENTLEFEMDPTQTDKNKVELTFYVSVEAGHEGNITAKVGGRALDEEYEVVLGKAIAPVKVEAEVAKIKAGVRDQEIGKITITETKAEAIKENADIILELDKDMEWDDEPTVKVVKGDLEIDEDDVTVDDNILTIHVDEESSEPSVIEITDGRIIVDRAIAEGAVKLEVKGDAIIQNGYVKDLSDGNNGTVKKSDQLEEYGRFDTDYFAKVEVANVITPADADTKAAEPAKFVIGNAEYQVGEEVRTADVAPYIKDGRTMLSLRYVAEAMGVANENIMWDGATKTVTIFKGDRIAQVQIGSDKLMVGGATITMDTVAEIKDGRTMLPVSFVAKALGAEVEWDGATRTVTIK